LTHGSSLLVQVKGGALYSYKKSMIEGSNVHLYEAQEDV
jgi:hypothetical protein